MKKERLSKVLAYFGLASRRACEELIQHGHVRVNRKRILLPQTLVDRENDVIEVRGERLEKKFTRVYYAVHKPLGYTCTNSPRIRKRVVDLLPQKEGVRLFTVGRLDRDTSGLILVTNDGHFANRIMHPSGGVKKEYLAKVDREITHEHLCLLSQGCFVQGLLVKPVTVKKVRRSTVRIVVQEGRYHEVRELLHAARLKVLELTRIRIGPLSLGKLPIGAFKPLSQEEVEKLFPS